VGDKIGVKQNVGLVKLSRWGSDSSLKIGPGGNVSFPVTFSDSERQDAMDQFFRRISVITLVSFHLE